MTREEAITKYIVPAIERTWNDKICKEILEALEQEPCEDAISRQAVIDTVESWLSCDDYNEAERHIMRAVQSVLYDLPPVTPKPKTGHWRHYEGMLICSECGTEFYDDIMEYCGDDVPKCCPNCGCRMVDPQERSDKE